MVVEGGGEFSVGAFPADVEGCTFLPDDCDDVESCLGRDVAPSLAADSSS